MKRDGLENVHAEKVMVPKWVRGNESAEHRPAGTPCRWRCSASAAAWPRLTTASRRRSSSCTPTRSSRRTRAKARGRIVLFNVALYELRRDRRGTAGTGHRAPRATAPSPCSSARSARTACVCPTPARSTYAADAPRIPAAAISSEDADRLQRMADRGERIVVRLRMEGALRARRRVGERRRRDSRARTAGRNRRRQRPPRFVGRRRRRDRRWRRLRGVVGGAAHHEEAQPAAAPHRPRRAVDQRGERRPRRARVSRSAPRRARQARADDGVGQRRLPPARVRLHRQRRRAPDRHGDRHAAVGPGRRPTSSPAATAPTSAPAPAPAASPACRSRSTPRSTSRFTTRRPTPSTRSIRSRWRNAPRRSR